MLAEISHELTNYFPRLGQSETLQQVKPYVTFTSKDIYMIFKVAFDIEIVKFTTLYGENSSTDHAQI